MSSFDFEQAIKDAQSDLVNKSLFLILLGQQGGGKSYAQGTYGGKTLYIYAQGESHGPRNAKTLGGTNIMPSCIDRVDGVTLSPDESLKRLHDMLDDIEGIKKMGIKAIALDGATEIEAIIRETKSFKEKTLKPFTDGPVELAAFREILNKLKKLQRELNVHVCVTCILEVKEVGEDGEILDSTPKLHGYQVAAGLVQQFDDVLVVGRMTKGEKKAHRFQLLAGVSKTSTDFATKVIKKTVNFTPRITGVDILSLGATLDADLGKLAELKAGGK